MSEIVEFIEEVAGIYFRSVLLPNPWMTIPQHVHPYDHATLIGSGKVALWIDGELEGEYSAGTAVFIGANKRHVFESLEANTRLTCIHDTTSANFIKANGL